MALSVEVRAHWKGQWVYWKLMTRGVAWLDWLLLMHGGEIRRFRTPQPTEERYRRPPRRYDLPPYEASIVHCRSRQRFLRPSRCCNPHAPEVIALAHSLGAYRKSEAEFAEAAFAFAKDRVVFEIGPITPVQDTLRRGTGSCFDCISVFIALCRCAGIPSITAGIVPWADVELVEAFVHAEPGEPPARMPSVVETIHNGCRDEIDAIQESALQLVRHWALKVVERYVSWKAVTHCPRCRCSAPCDRRA